MDDDRRWEPSAADTAVAFAAQVLGLEVHHGPVSPRTPVGQLELLCWELEQLGVEGRAAEVIGLRLIRSQAVALCFHHPDEHPTVPPQAVTSPLAAGA